MKASELIRRLKRRIAIYGDCECIVRYDEGEEEFDLTCVYADEDAERIVLSDDLDTDGEIETEYEEGDK